MTFTWALWILFITTFTQQKHYDSRGTFTQVTVFCTLSSTVTVPRPNTIRLKIPLNKQALGKKNTTRSQCELGSQARWPTRSVHAHSLDLVSPLISTHQPKQCHYQHLPSDTLLATRRLMDNRNGGEEQSRSGSRCNRRSDVNLAERRAFGG